MSQYAVVIEDAGPNFSAYVPDLPGCVSAGYTLEEVTANIRVAMTIHIAALIEFVKSATALVASFARRRRVVVACSATFRRS